MYQKYLVVASKKDSAGSNITTQLSQFRKNSFVNSIGDEPSFDFYLTDTEIIKDSGINQEKINKYDFIIFASKHKSEKKEKSFSVHAPGNFRTADFGGQIGKMCPTSAFFQKQLFEKLKLYADKFHMKDYNVTLECTHHGPLINKPCIFVEIGSTENEWKDTKAGFVVAKTIFEAIKDFKPNKYNEIAIGIGGPHYCPNFNMVQLNSNIALSHIIPQYVLPLDEEWIKEAAKKTQEEIDFALLDWKGLGNAEQRKQVTDTLDKLYIRYKKTSEIEK